MLRDQKLLPLAGCCMLACGAAFGVMRGLAGAAPGLVGAVVALGAVASVLGAVAEGVAVVLVVVCAWTRPAKPVAAARAITAVRVRFIRTLHNWGRISHPPNNSCAMMFPVRGKVSLRTPAQPSVETGRPPIIAATHCHAGEPFEQFHDRRAVFFVEPLGTR